ncbi:hypothetical protein MKX03_011477, partial [Papaver bracteatum]
SKYHCARRYKIVGNKEWYYMFCRDRSKKVVGDERNYWCTKFETEVGGPVP